jgi:hypothetical protein
MDFKDFIEKSNNGKKDSQNINWLKLKKDESVKVIIPQKTLGMFQALYIQGANNKGQTLKLTEETYELLVQHKAVPMVKSDNSQYLRKPQTKGFVNVINLTTNQVAVWEVSRGMIQKLDAMDKDHDTPPLTECIIKITKRSTGPSAKDVDYDIFYLGKAELTDEQKKLTEQLYDVEKLAGPHSEEYILKFLGIEDEEEIPI